jgi:hypothetical protein
VIHFAIAPSEFWQLTTNQYWCLAKAYDPDQFHQAINRQEDFFTDEEQAVFAELKEKFPDHKE